MTNAEFNQLFCDRTKAFAVALVLFVESLPYNTSTKVMGTQLMRSGTSDGANFRAFCRSRSQNERFAKICTVVEEADEVLYWLDLMKELSYIEKTSVTKLNMEGLEILRVVSKIKKKMYDSRN